MIRKSAIILSILQHPLLMPTYLFAILFFYAPIIVQPLAPDQAQYILLAVFITTFVLPMVSVVAMRFSAWSTSGPVAALSMPTRQERVLPFFFTSLFYLIVTYMFVAKLSVSTVLIVVLATITAIIILTSAITLLVRVSTHSVGSGAMVGLLIGLGIQYPEGELIVPLVMFVLLGGLVMSAQLYLNTHRPDSVLLGCLMGLTTSLSAMLLLVS